MQHLLSAANRPVVALLAQEQTLCAFDFDGTLAPIVDHPQDARLRPETQRLLRRLSEIYPCAIISGRARADVLARLDGLSFDRVIGNHGVETGYTHGSLNGLSAWKSSLEADIGSIPGVWIEDKGFSLAVHYRNVAYKAETRRRILAASDRLPHARVFGGKQVVNLVLDNAPHKGDALAAERDHLNCKWVLYVGDDDNDEDAFALGGNIVPVRIGRKLKSHARYYLNSQSEIDRLLDLLVNLRCRIE